MDSTDAVAEISIADLASTATPSRTAAVTPSPAIVAGNRRQATSGVASCRTAGALSTTAAQPAASTVATPLRSTGKITLPRRLAPSTQPLRTVPTIRAEGRCSLAETSQLPRLPRRRVPSPVVVMSAVVVARASTVAAVEAQASMVEAAATLVAVADTVVADTAEQAHS